MRRWRKLLKPTSKTEWWATAWPFVVVVLLYITVIIIVI